MKILNLILYITKIIMITKRIINSNKINSITKYINKIMHKIIKFIKIVLKLIMQIIIMFNINKIYNKKYKLYKIIKLMALNINNSKKT